MRSLKISIVLVCQERASTMDQPKTLVNIDGRIKKKMALFSERLYSL